MRRVICTLLVVLGIVLGLYVGVWVMFVTPILSACALFDQGMLTATYTAYVVIKCLLATPVGIAIFLFCSFIGGMFVADAK